jgi:hypothetical protein
MSMGIDTTNHTTTSKKRRRNPATIGTWYVSMPGVSRTSQLGLAVLLYSAP